MRSAKTSDMSDISNFTRTKRLPLGTGAALLTAAGFAGAFGAAACCALPFFLATAGLGTAWLGGIALVAAPHRALLLGVSAICLAGGAALLWRQRTSTSCSPGAICARPAVRRLTLAGLLAGLALLYLGYIYV